MVMLTTVSELLLLAWGCWLSFGLVIVRVVLVELRFFIDIEFFISSYNIEPIWYQWLAYTCRRSHRRRVSRGFWYNSQELHVRANYVSLNFFASDSFDRNLDTGFIVLQHDLFVQTVELATGYTLPLAMSSTSPKLTVSVLHMANKPYIYIYIAF